MTDTRRCRIPDCTKSAGRRRTRCYMHIARIARNGHPDRWTGINPHDVDTVVRDRRHVPGLSTAERQLITRHLTSDGLSAREIARILCVSERTIVRWRTADRVALDAEPVPAGGARMRLVASPASQDSHPALSGPYAQAQAVA